MVVDQLIRAAPSRDRNISIVLAGQSLESKWPATAIGSSASRTMIEATSTMRLAGSNPLQIPSDQKCYPCPRN